MPEPDNLYQSQSVSVNELTPTANNKETNFCGNDAQLQTIFSKQRPDEDEFARKSNQTNKEWDEVKASHFQIDTKN